MIEPDPSSPAPSDGLRIGPSLTIPGAALTFSFISSSGPGGQNVNKRATKCLLRVRLDALPISPGQRARLVQLAGSVATDAGDLLITADDNRSQLRNRDECLDKLAGLIRRALVAPKVRRATRPTRGSKERRLQAKRVQSDRKRRRSDLD
jgi:ribosome-associated protein